MERFRESLLSTIVTAGLVCFSTAAMAANIAIIGGKTDDSFFAVVKKGIDDAAKIIEQRGGTVNYFPLQTYDNIGADAAQLIRTAISQGAQGIAAPDWVPEAQDEAYKAASAAGIPIFVYNSGGAEKSKELGSINYVGTEDYQAGLAAGEYLAAHDAKNVLCVNTVPGAANLEARCRGVIEPVVKAGSKAVQLPLPANSFGDKTAVSEAVKATLLQDETIDTVITQGDQDADAAAIAIEQAGAKDRVKLGSFNMDRASLDRIKAGTQMFAVDQQGYLQGFLTVFLLDSYIEYGMQVPTMPILTGPLVVDSENVDHAMNGVAAGVR